MNFISNFSDLIRFLKEKQNFIKKTASIVFLLSCIYAFTSNVYYKSEITLYPAGELSNNREIFSDFSDIIDNLGINELSSDNNFYIPDIIKSKSLKKKIVNKKWDNKKYNSPKNLIEYWEIDKSTWSSTIIKYINNYFNKFSNQNISEYELVAIEKIDKLIYVDENNSGLIEIAVLMDEPDMASDIANYISSYVVDYVINEQRHFATKNKEYLSDRLLLSQQDLFDSENNLTDFREKFPLSHDTPTLQLERLRLTRTVTVNQELYVMLKKQLELAKIEESKERLFINILDKASPAIYKEYPKRFIIIISFTFLGTLIGILYLLSINSIKQFYLRDN